MLSAKSRGVITGIGIALGAVVLFQNTHVVVFRFLFWSVSMSQIILMAIILSIGIGIGYLTGKRSW